MVKIVYMLQNKKNINFSMDPITTMLLITNTINLMNCVMINCRPRIPPPQCDCHLYRSKYEDEKPKQVENKQEEKAVEEGNTKRC